MKFRKKCFSKHSKRRKSIEKYRAQAITLTSNKHKEQTSQSSHNQCVTIFLRRINPLNSKYNSSLNVHTFSLILIEKIMIWIDFWCWNMRKTTTETSLFALKITQKMHFYLQIHAYRAAWRADERSLQDLKQGSFSNITLWLLIQ